MTHSNNIVGINQCTFILNPILTNWHHRKNIPQDSEAPCHACHIKSPTIIWGIYQCCHCTPDCTKIPLLGCDTLQTDIPLYNGKGFWTFLAFEDGLRCRFRHYNHPFKGWKLPRESKKIVQELQMSLTLIKSLNHRFVVVLMKKT